MPKTYSHPAYRLHKATRQAVITLDGRTIYLGRYGSPASQEKYDRLILEWTANGRSLPPEPDQQLTLVEIAAGYKRFAHGYYRKHGKLTDTYAAVCRTLQMVCSLYGRTPAEEFSPRAIKALLHHMTGKGWSRKFINENLGTIKRWLKWAVAEELIPVAVQQAIDVVPGLRKGRCEAKETGPVLPVEDATVEQTLTKLGPVVAAMVKVQRLTAMRPSEVCLMRPCDIDRSGEVWVYTPSEHKTEHHDISRRVAIGRKAQEILMPFLDREPSAFCFSPSESEQLRRKAEHANRKTPLGYGNRPGSNRRSQPKRIPRDGYTQDTYRRAIHRACDLAFPAPAGLTAEQIQQWQSDHRWAPNRLRHTAATQVRKQFGLESAQVVLGHKQASITQVYAERDLNRALEVAAEIG
jgi:integrase